MPDSSELLLLLAEKDARLHALGRDLKEQPARHAERVAAHVAEGGAIAEVEGQVKVLQASIDRRNRDVAGLETQLHRLQNQLLETKTSEEYATMERQIAGKKTEIEELEDKVLQSMEIIEEAGGALPERKATFEAEASAIAEAATALEASVSAWKAEHATLESEWKGAVQGLDDAADALYRPARKRHPGDPLAEVTDSETCGGCHTKLTMQLVTQAGAGKMVACQQCARILGVL